MRVLSVTSSPLPWVTCVVVALFLSVFAYLRLEENEAIRATKWAEHQALGHLLDHRPLSYDPRLVGDSAPVRPTVDRNPDDDRAQDKLDSLTQAWLESLDDNPLWKLGLVPSNPRLLATVAHLFTHVSPLHLFGSLFLVLLAAPDVELRFGHGWFAGFFVASGVAASFLYCLLHGDQFRPMIGATGAVSAIVGAYAAMNVKWIKKRHLSIPSSRGRMWAVLVAWYLAVGTVEDLETVWTQLSAVNIRVVYMHPQTALFGFVIGASLAAAHRRVIDPQPTEAALTAMRTEAELAVVLRAEAARHEGRIEEAWRLLHAEGWRHPDRDGVMSTLWRLAAELDRCEVVVPLMQESILATVRRDSLRQAVELWRRLDAQDAEAAGRPDVAVAVARTLETLGEVDEADELVRRAVANLEREPPIDSLLELFDQVKDEPELNDRVAGALLAHPETPPTVLRRLTESMSRSPGPLLDGPSAPGLRRPTAGP